MTDSDSSNIEESLDSKKGFVTFKNYLLGLSYLIDNLHPTYQALESSIEELAINPSVDANSLRKMLFNSWNTELLLLAPTLFTKELIKYSNHWAAVQCYYSIYLSIRALFQAKGLQVEERHEKALEAIQGQILMNSIVPAPWNLLLTHDGYKNLPATKLEKCSNLENPYFFQTNTAKLWNCPMRFIKTTRELEIEKRSIRWKKKNQRKKLPKGKDAEIDRDIRPFSIFDCLYRLRIRSNYEEADMYISSAEFEAENYIEAICNITDKTLFVVERQILSLIGKEKMLSFVNAFTSRQKDTSSIFENAETGIFRRAEYFKI